jgi:3-oxoacyl-[acyl-carrier protein] reductase
MTGRLGDHVALITGGGSGIGRVTALRFAAEGATVAIADIEAARADAVADEIRKAGGQASAVVADVSVAADVARMTQAVVSAWGRVTVLVNNAGIVVRSGLEATSDEAWARELAVDLGSVFLCCRSAVPAMRASGRGSMINIASVAGIMGAVSPAYTAAKGGVIALTRQLAGELAPSGIRVNSISPGFIATPLNAAVRAAGLDSVIGDRIPLGRWGEPEDVAGACVFLASDDAGYVTGTNLIVDGGLSSVLDLGEAYRSFDASRRA